MDEKIKGEVLEMLPNVRFRVELENGRVILCYLAGKLQKNFIKVIISDKVLVVVPSTGDIGRIIKRY